jgi:hypothetical protein
MEAWQCRLERELQPISASALTRPMVRGAEIILTKRRNRVIFIAGLVGFVVLALILNWFA